jgi:hypothetical protein
MKSREFYIFPPETEDESGHVFENPTPSDFAYWKRNNYVPILVREVNPELDNAYAECEKVLSLFILETERIKRHCPNHSSYANYHIDMNTFKCKLCGEDEDSEGKMIYEDKPTPRAEITINALAALKKARGE